MREIEKRMATMSIDDLIALHDRVNSLKHNEGSPERISPSNTIVIPDYHTSGVVKFQFADWITQKVRHPPFEQFPPFDVDYVSICECDHEDDIETLLVFSDPVNAKIALEQLMRYMPHLEAFASPNSIPNKDTLDLELEKYQKRPYYSEYSDGDTSE